MSATKNFAFEGGRRLLLGTAVLLIVIGVFAENIFGYWAVTAAIIFPIAIWYLRELPGIPTLPLVATLCYVYYALPLFRGTITQFELWEIDRAAFTVSLFMFAATLSWGLLVGKDPAQEGSQIDVIADSQLFFVACAGFAAGIIFLFASNAGLLTPFGVYVGVIRAVMLSFAGIGSYLTGYGRARGILVGGRWAVALGLLIALVVANLISLFLVGAALTLISASLGYVVIRKKLPLRPVLAMIVVFTVLHAGKAEMREKYWGLGTQDSSVNLLTILPSVIVNWTATGIDNLVSQKVKEDTLIERTSLLQMLTLAQHFTPETIPYLGGETYYFLFETMMPRFLNPDKSSSQSGLNLLSVRYGMQNPDSTRNTTIAWGIIAEAFSNFGYPGVAIIGILFGVVSGLFMRWSASGSAFSILMLISIAATINLINIEADFSYLMLNILQSTIAVLIVTIPLRLFRGKVA